MKDSLSNRDGSILTQKQREILAQVAAGATNEQIADRVCTSTHTVNTHSYNVYNKINVPNRLQAILWAIKNL